MAGFSPEQVRRFREAGFSDEEIAAGLEPPPPEPFLGIEEEPPPPPPPAPDEFGGLPPLEQAALGLRFAGMERVLGHRLSPAERAQEIGQVRRNMAHVEDLGIGRRIAAPLVTLPSAIGGLFAGIAEEVGTAEAFGGVVEADPATGEGRVVEPEPLRRPTPAPAPSRGPISGAFGRTEEDLERRLGRSFYENARSDVVDNITGVLQVLASGLGLTPTPEQLRSDDWWTEQAGRGLRFGEEMTGGLVGGSAALLRHPVTALRTRPLTTALTMIPVFRAARVAMPAKVASVVDRVGAMSGRAAGGATGAALGSLVSPETAGIGLALGVSAQHVAPWILDRLGMVDSRGLRAAVMRWLADPTRQESVSAQAVVDRIHDVPEAVRAEVEGIAAELSREIRGGRLVAEDVLAAVEDVPLPVEAGVPARRALLETPYEQVKGRGGMQDTAQTRALREMLKDDRAAQRMLDVSDEVLGTEERAALARGVTEPPVPRTTIPQVSNPKFKESAERLAAIVRETYKEDQLLTDVSRGAVRGIQRGMTAEDMNPHVALGVVTDILDTESLAALRSPKFRQDVLERIKAEHPDAWEHMTAKGVEERLRSMGESVLTDLQSETVPMYGRSVGVRPGVVVTTPLRGATEAWEYAKTLDMEPLSGEDMVATLRDRHPDVAWRIWPAGTDAARGVARDSVLAALTDEVSLGREALATAADLAAESPGRLAEIQAEAMSRLGAQIAKDAYKAKAQALMTEEYERFAAVGEDPIVWMDGMVRRVLVEGEAMPQLLSIRKGGEIAKDLRGASATYADAVLAARGVAAGPGHASALKRAEREVLDLADRYQRDYRPPHRDLMRDGLPRYQVLDATQLAAGKGPRLITHAKDIPPVTAVARGFNDTFGWHFRTLREMEDAGQGLRTAARVLKGNLTAHNPTTHVNNFLANTGLQSIRQGKLPFEVLADLRDSHALWRRYRDGGLPHGRDLDLMRAVERSGLLDSSLLDAEMGGAGAEGLLASLGNKLPGLRPATDMVGKPWDWMERGYSWGDGIFKLDETLRQAATIDRSLDGLKPGEWRSLDLPRDRRIYVGARKDGSLGMSRTQPPDSPLDAVTHAWQDIPDRADLVVRAASKPALDLFFDYGLLPLHLQALKGTGSLMSVASAFLTWGWKALDIPGVKPGLLHRTLVPEAMATNSTRLKAAAAEGLMGLATRRLLVSSAMRSSLLEADDEAIRQAFRYQPRDLSVVMLQAVSDPGYAAVKELGSVNSLAPTDALFRGGHAAFLQMADTWDPEGGWSWDPERPDSEADEQFLRGYPDDKAAELRLRRTMVRDQLAGEVFGEQDLLKLIGLSGSPFADVIYQMLQDDRRGVVHPEGWAWQRYGALAVGGLTHKVLDVAWGGYREWADAGATALGEDALDALTSWRRAAPADPVEAAYKSGRGWVSFTRHLVRRLTGLGWDVRSVAQEGQERFTRRRAAITRSLTKELSGRITTLDGEIEGLLTLARQGHDMTAAVQARHDQRQGLQAAVEAVRLVVADVVDEEQGRWNELERKLSRELLEDIVGREPEERTDAEKRP